MAITLKQALLDPLTGQLGEKVFGAFGSDPTYRTSLPAEGDIRQKLSFSNVRISFPTSGINSITSLVEPNRVIFPAYIEKLENEYKMGVTPKKIYGRLDPIPVYTGNERSVTISLKIPCFDANDANENMKKINQIIRSLYPGYNEFKGDLIIGSTPLIRIKFANLITDHKFGFRGLLGYVTAFKHSFETKKGFLFGNDSSGNQNLFFRSYTITFTMTVLHEAIFNEVNGSSISIAENYPYRTNIDLTSNAGLAPGNIRKQRREQFGISGDLEEQKILGG